MSVQIPSPRMLTEREAEALLSFRPGTLASARYHQRPTPPYIRTGARTIRYAEADLLNWIDRRRDVAAPRATTKAS